VVSLAVALGGLGWELSGRWDATAAEVIGVPAAGLAGAVLTGLVPVGPAYLVMYLVLIIVGMNRPFVPALVTGLVVCAATDLAFLLSGKASVVEVASVDVGAAFFFTVGVSIRSTRISRDRASAAQARAEQLLAQLRDAQAAQAEAVALAERARLAREIHDILAHALSGLVLALDTAELLGRRQDADTAAIDRMLEQIARAQRIARDGLADTRRAVSALRGDELPGPALLDRLVRQTSEATGILASFAVQGDQRPLPPEIALTLYRTAQEALINTAKYAGRGGTAGLRLTYRPDDVELEIEDTRSPDAATPAPAGRRAAARRGADGPEHAAPQRRRGDRAVAPGPARHRGRGTHHVLRRRLGVRGAAGGRPRFPDQGRRPRRDPARYYRRGGGARAARPVRAATAA
jgi:signal transduction histidine kinase